MNKEGIAKMAKKHKNIEKNINEKQKYVQNKNRENAIKSQRAYYRMLQDNLNFIETTKKKVDLKDEQFRKRIKNQTQNSARILHPQMSDLGKPFQTFESP